MTAIYCQPIGRGRRRGRLADTFEREWQWPFRVKTNNPADDAYVVITTGWALGLPTLSSPHPLDPFALVKSFDAQEENHSDPTVWTVMVLFSTETVDPNLQNVDPVDEPPQIRSYIERIEQGITMDLLGNAIVNSAGDLFVNPAATMERGILCISYRDNVALDDYDFGEPLNYCYCANQFSFQNFPEQTLVIADFQSERGFRNGIEFVTRNILFKVDLGINPNQTPADQTQLVLLDQGYRDKNKLPLGAGGTWPSSPVLLNGSGLALASGAAPIGLSFTVRYVADFSALDLFTIPVNLGVF